MVKDNKKQATVLVTWLKGECDEVYFWLGEHVVYITTADTANFEVPLVVAEQILPQLKTADIFDWNFIELSYETLSTLYNHSTGHTAA